MKSKSIIIMDSFTSWDIFSPAKFYFITVSINFWWRNNRMPSSTLHHLRMVHENLSHLLFLHLELFLVGNREPSAASVDLENFWKSGFERRFLHYSEELSLETIWPILEHTDIHHTSRNSSSWYEDFLAWRRVYGKTYASEDEFFYENIL